MSQISQYPAPTSQFVLTIGDIGITRDHVVTPRGSAPLRSAQWIFADRTMRTRTTPTWAIVLACVSVFLFIWVFLLGLLGLLFLLAKEDRIAGTVDVQVYAEGVYHLVQIPVYSYYTVSQIHQQVSQAQSMSAHAQLGG